MISTDPSPEVVRRRAVINAYAAVREAARGVVPDFESLGYDLSLGLDEQSAEPTPPTINVAAGGAVIGTILAFGPGGPPGGTHYSDVDRVVLTTPPTPGVYVGGRVELRYLASPSATLGATLDRGALTVAQQGATPDGVEQFVIYALPPLFAGASIELRVAGALGTDGMYKLRVFPAAHAPGLTPDRYDRIGGAPSGHPHNNSRDTASPVGAAENAWVHEPPLSDLAGHGWTARVPDLSLHAVNDVDWFVVTLPDHPEVRAGRACSPHLTVEAAPGVMVTVVDSSGTQVAQGEGAVTVSLTPILLARAPFYVQLTPSGVGPVNYELTVSVGTTSAMLCERLFELRGRYRPRRLPVDGRIVIGGGVRERFPIIDPLDDPTRLRGGGGVVRPGDGFVVDWRGGPGFKLEALLPATSSARLVLEDVSGKVHAEALATAGMGLPQRLTVSNDSLESGAYVLRVLDVDEGTELHVTTAHAPQVVTPVERSIPINPVFRAVRRVSPCGLP
jgi:hypothetical protein